MPCMTMAMSELGVGMKDAARLMSRRMGVSATPMISLLVSSAPSQWVTSMTSWPDTPGTKYLLPPEKPATSCGKTGPQTRSSS